MKLKLFAIYDRALTAYMQPFGAQSAGAAIRAFGDGVNDPAHVMNKHPEDYELWYLGDFDDQTGTFDNHDRAKSNPQIATGKNMIQARN